MNKTLYIFDFDGTLIESDAKVLIHHLDAGTSYLNSTEFVSYEKKPGDQFDFSEFEIYPPGGKIIPETFKILQKLIQEPESNNVIILTARGSYEPVRHFLSDQGLPDHIPIIAVNSANPWTKAAYVVKQLKTNNYNKVHVYEDNFKNIDAIQKVVNDAGISFDYTLITSNKIKSNKHECLREFIRYTLIKKY